MQMIMDSFQPNFKSKAKNYKYFFRGQYGVVPDSEDIIAGMTTKKQKLQPFEKALKQFQYKRALNEALEQANPETTVALIEELVQRGALEIALANRTAEEVQKVLQFVAWKVSDHRYQPLLVQVLRFLIDMYQGVLGTGQSPEVDSLVTEDLRKTVGS